MSDEFERVRGAVPGKRSRRLLQTLRRYESRNVTYVGDDFPIVWESASGSTVCDVDGNRYLDLTAAFGVASVGHANPRVAAAVAAQAARLAHGMGDVHPSSARVRLLEELARIAPRGLSKAYLTTSGSEAVEAALKTAAIASEKPRVVAFRGGYHGLSLGALSVIGMPKFRRPFSRIVGRSAFLTPFPRRDADLDAALSAAETALRRDGVGALLVEPIQGRAGAIVPPRGFLRGLRELCDRFDVVMIADEIYTGFGRTGRWFAVQHEGVVPDILCIGKAMGGGFPIAAIVAKPAVMDAWPESSGEALHTSTFLGNPMGCASALATIDELRRHNLPARAAALEPVVAAHLQRIAKNRSVRGFRGRGLLWAIAMRDAATAERVVKAALQKGVIVLQTGTAGDAIAISPPLTISRRQLERALSLFASALPA